jgi:hypothetical protein
MKASPNRDSKNKGRTLIWLDSNFGPNPDPRLSGMQPMIRLWIRIKILNYPGAFYEHVSPVHYAKKLSS